MDSDKAIAFWNELASDSPMFRTAAIFASDAHIDKFDAVQLRSAGTFLKDWSEALLKTADEIEKEDEEESEEDDASEEELSDTDEEVP